jgi:hypothetical protein
LFADAPDNTLRITKNACGMQSITGESPEAFGLVQDLPLPGLPQQEAVEISETRDKKEWTGCHEP